MKLYKYKTPSEPINYYKTDIQVEIPETYKAKQIRGMWVSNVVNIDLPTTEDIDSYQEKVIKMLETCISYNINTIFFQVRTTNDAFYESKLNPYSRYLTGKEGKKPPFDILKWIISEAQKREIDVHAWCNPYRVSMSSQLTKDAYLEACDDLNFAKRHPELTILDKKGQIILNPCKKEVKDFIIASMLEILENYDVAGVHFDDYFYPYAGLDEVENDLKDYELRDNKSLSLDEFRRQQVSDVIFGVHEAVKKYYPNKQFGVSPFGIWKNKANDPKGSNTDPACSQSYDNQYADALKWVKEGYIDYIVPQIYWELGHRIAPFADILEWWVDACKDTNVELYIGHGAYRYGNEGEFENPLEVVNQLKYANQYDIVKGNVFFTYKTFINQDKSKQGMEELKKILTGGNTA